MKHAFVRCLAALLATVLMTTLAPAALMEADVAPVEAIDAAVPETDSVELDANDELPVEDGFVSNESYQAEMPSYEETGAIPIDEAHFPDPIVRNTLLTDIMRYDTNTYYDNNRNGWLDADEIANITVLRLGSESGMHSLDFRSLELLTALEQIDINKYSGTILDCTSLTNVKMIAFYSSDTLTTVIYPACEETIYFLDCPNVSTVDISRCTRLTSLYMKGGGAVESLDLSNNSNMESIICDSKALKSLTLGNQPKLKRLMCCNNTMTSLDISACPLLIPVVKDKYKTNIKAGGFEPYDSVNYGYPGEDYTVSVSPTIKLITGEKGGSSSTGGEKSGSSSTTEKKSETVTPTADNTIVTTATSTKTTADVGQSYTLSAAGQKASGLKSSNSKVATVTKTGKVVPKKAGKVKITYKVNGKTRMVTLTVKDPTMPTKVSLNMTGTNAGKVGDKVTLTATLNEGAKSAIQWTTSDKKVATVKNGVVTFKKAGKVTITATTKRGNKKAKVKFTVTK